MFLELEYLTSKFRHIGTRKKLPRTHRHPHEEVGSSHPGGGDGRGFLRLQFLAESLLFDFKINVGQCSAT